jgi:phage FluMu protein gp41
MTESNKLTALREMLVRRRRAIVEDFHGSSIERLSGDDLARVQNEIEAVDKAIAEEQLAEFQV